ncbi:Druantia anti-phage system protein DruA [Candidatus Kuenenia stuttgartiensis]|uniref:Druantia anti-phage system protein DruA n=1 Tax=Kuenenia stuttgartiensis TaxID=174633 RepID=UPI00146A1A46
MSCELAELGDVEIIAVTTRINSKLWRSMLEAHHYLGSGPLCGAQLRYLVRSEHYGWIGGLSYSACARRWKVATSG